MRNLQYQTAIRIFVWLTALSFISLSYLMPDMPMTELTLEKLLARTKPIGLVVLIHITLWTLFSKWGWKLAIFRGWLVKCPDLNGIWKGRYESSSNHTGNISLTICQSLTTISCKSKTDNGTSTSYVSEILYEPEKQHQKLVFSYNYELNSNRRNIDHRGTYDLEIMDKGKELKGNYWTSKPTTGRVIILSKIQ